MEHFGLKLIKRKYHLKLVRDEFALINTKPSFEGLIDIEAYTDSTYSAYTIDWCNSYRKLCLEHFDLNMKYFKQLNKIEFNNALNNFLKYYPEFVEITDLSHYNQISGYYIMVLDEYCQVYIGKSNDICKRIRAHWNKTKPLDRVLCPMYAVKSSCFSIDFFRALDTTRVFIWKRPLIDGLESKLIRDFPNQFCTNRIGGDVSSLLNAYMTANKRDLT